MSKRVKYEPDESVYLVTFELGDMSFKKEITAIALESFPLKDTLGRENTGGNRAREFFYDGASIAKAQILKFCNEWVASKDLSEPPKDRIVTWNPATADDLLSALREYLKD